MANTTTALDKAFGSSDAATALRERLKLAFAELIPDEQWEELLKQEFEKFTKDTPGPYHNSPKQTSQLTLVVREVLREEVRELIRERLSSSEAKDEFMAGLKEQIEEQIPKVLQDAARSLLIEASKNLVDSLAYRIADKLS